MSQRPLTPARGAAYSLAVLSFINLFNYIDRYLVAGALPLIGDHFKINHVQEGLLGSAFMLVYMVASPVGGFLGDRLPRKYLAAAGVFLWSLATVGSGLAWSFASFLFARAIIGIGEAGYGAVAPSQISDLYPRLYRSRALAFFYLAIPVGAGLGYAVGGLAAERYGWNVPFFAGGVPGLLLALLMLFSKEPERGAMEEGPPAPKTAFLVGLRALAGNPAFWFNTAGLTLMTFSIGGLSFWMPTFLHDERGLATGNAGLIFGGVTVVAGLLGTLAGGMLGDWAERLRTGGGMLVSGVGLLLAAPLMYLAANVQPAGTIFAVIFVAQVLLFLNTGPINAALVSHVSPDFRAFAMGINSLTIHLLGDAFSPVAIGKVAQVTSLARAIELNALPVLLAGAILLIGMRVVGRSHAPVTGVSAT